MILKRLSIRNFRQFREADIDFEPGLTAIVGANGSGKTTVIESVIWALYGEQRNTKETLRRISAEKRAPTSVAVSFVLDRQDWRVERTLTSASLLSIGETEIVAASSLKEVTKAVTRLLGLTYEQFRNSFCTEQRDLSFLKFRTPGRQQEELGRMLGYDRIRSAAKVAKERARSSSDAMRGLESALTSSVAILSALDAAKEQASQAQARVEEAQAAARIAKEAAEGSEENRRRAREAATLIVQMRERRLLGRQLEAETTRAAADVERLERDVARREELEPRAADYESAHRSFRELTRLAHQVEERARIGASISLSESRVAELETEIAQHYNEPVCEDLERAKDRASRAAEEAREAHQRWQATRSTAETEHAQAAARHEELERRASELRSSIDSGNCPVCGQKWPKELVGKLEEVQRAAEEARAVAEQKASCLAALSAPPDEVQIVEIEAQKARDELDRANAMMADRERKCKELDAIRQGLAKDIAKMRSMPEAPDPAALADCERRMHENEKAAQEFAALGNAPQQLKDAQNRLAEARAKFDEEKAEQSRARDELTTLGYRPDDKDRADNEATHAEALIQKAKDTERDSDHARQVLDEKSRVVESAKRAAQQHEKIEERAAELRRDAKLLGETGAALGELREALNERTRPLLEQLGSSNLATLSGGRYLALKLTDRFEARVLDDNVEKDVISGGEEDIVALSLRLALAQLIQERSGQPMSMLILDEVFGSLDVERRVNVMMQLEAMRDMFDQMIVISHIEAINDAADRCLIVRYDPATRESRVFEETADLNEIAG